MRLSRCFSFAENCLYFTDPLDGSLGILSASEGSESEIPFACGTEA